MLARVEVTVEGSDAPVAMSIGLIYSFKDGWISRVASYYDVEAALGPPASPSATSKTHPRSPARRPRLDAFLPLFGRKASNPIDEAASAGTARRSGPFLG